MRTIAYLRVSTIEQNLEKNKSEILKLAYEKKLGNIEFIEEKISGKISWKKRKIFDIIQNTKRGDNLIVSELSRLGRSMLEIMEILSIAKDKGISVYAVKGNWNLDNTIQSKIIAMAFSMASEIERDLISSRTREALQVKKMQGVILGRPKGKGKSRLDKYRHEIKAMLKSGSTKKFIAQKYNISEQGFYNWLNQNHI